MTKDEIHFIDKEFHKGMVDNSLRQFTEPIEPEPISILPDGRINIECHCLQSVLAHRCGYLMREAISCFNTSTRTPRGTECEEEFTRHAMCMSKCEK